jgi:hypothetical protein
VLADYYRQTLVTLVKHQYWVLGIIILFGVTLRIVRVAELCHIGKDEIYYVQVASYWAENDTLLDKNKVNFISPHPPLFLYLVSRLIKVGVPPLSASRGINIISAPVFILAMYFAALTLLKSRKTALICAFFAAIAPETARFSVLGLREPWAIALYTCSLAFAIKAMTVNSIKPWVISGAFIMLGAMFRFACLELFLIYPVAIIFAWFYDRKIKTIRSIVAIYGGAAVCFFILVLILQIDSRFYSEAYGARMVEKFVYMLRL